MVLPQAMAWVQYWFRVLSLKFCGKSKKNCGDISQVSPAFCMYESRTADSHILPIWNVSNVFFSCWDFLPSIQAVGLFWLGITTESTWFTCTPTVSKSAMGRQQFQTIYIYIFIELCIWLFNAVLVDIYKLPNLSHLIFFIKWTHFFYKIC